MSQWAVHTSWIQSTRGLRIADISTCKELKSVAGSRELHLQEPAENSMKAVLKLELAPASEAEGFTEEVRAELNLPGQQDLRRKVQELGTDQ